MSNLRISSTVFIMLFLTLDDTHADKSESLSPGDFAYGAQLSSAKSSLRKFYPGPEILKDLTRSDAGDIRVYDSNNSAVPAYMRRAESEELKSDKSLEFYPLYETLGSDTQISSVDVIRNDENEIEKLVSSVQIRPSEQQISGYLIDQSDTGSSGNGHLSQLRLGWQENSHPDLLKMRVEHSTDLNNWKTVHSSVTISNLPFRGKVLQQNTINFPIHIDRFVKLTFFDREKRLTLNSVTASYRRINSRDHQWLSVGTLRKDKVDTNTYRFTISKGVRPLKLRFIFPATDILMSGKLYSQDNRKKWILRASSVSQYQVLTGDSVTESRPLDFPQTYDTEWKFVSDADNGISNDQLPEVEITYPSYEIVFISQGAGPYRTTWGSLVAEKQSTNMRQLIKDAARDGKIIEVVEIGKIKSILGSDALIEMDTEQWKRWILWLVMLLGVLAVARLAYRLFREMNSSEK